jgi:hypothetical protein
MTLPSVVADYLVNNKDRFPLGNPEPIALSELADALSQLTSLPLDEMIRQEWWLNLRKDVLWVLKK